MSDKSSVELSKKDKRELSPFIGHELLYDYLTEALDEDRKKAVLEHLKKSDEAQVDLEKIQSGKSYAELLAGTTVSVPVIEYISESKSYLTVLLKKMKFDRWPQGVKWGLEAMIVVFCIVCILLLIPWERTLQSVGHWGAKEYTLAEVLKEKTGGVEEELPEFVDEGIKEGETLELPKQAAQDTVKDAGKDATKTTSPVLGSSPALDLNVDLTKNQAIVPDSKPKEVAANKATTPQKVAGVKDAEAPSTPESGTVPAASSANVSPTTNVKTAQSETSPAAAPSVGYLYRGTISLTNIDAAESKITEKIEALGGRKAGSVNLGWKKTDNSLYYHFTIPEARYTELLTFLSTYGTPRFAKEKHSRIMPDGIIRLIFTVDEKEQ